MTRDEFEALDADLYGVPGDGEYTFESVRAYLLECGPVAPLVIAAFKRKTVDADFVTHATSDVTTLLKELFREEGYGHPEGDPDGSDDFSREAMEETWPALHAAITAFYARGVVWDCEEVGRYTYSAQDVREIYEGK